MKRIGSFVVLVSALFANATWANNDKIGVVDLREIFAKAPEVKVIKTNLEKRFKPRQEKLMAMQKNIKEKVDKLQKNGAVMSAADKKTLQQEIMSGQQALEKEGSQYQNDLNTAQNSAMETFFNKVKGIIDTVAKKEKYTLVLQRENVPYRSKELDITDAVIKAL